MASPDLSRPAADRAGGRGWWLWSSAIVVLVLAAYAPISRAGYIWDDDSYLTANPLIAARDGLWRIWTEPQASPQYYPLVFTTFWLEHRLWGQAAAGYHLVNVLLHALSACLVWRLLARYSVAGAWLAALVFALHPVHVESVAWISERKNVLSGLLYLVALLSFSRHAGLGRDRAAEAGDRRFWWLALVAFVLALFSKTATCTLPLVILLVAWWQRRLGRPVILGTVPFFAVGLLLGLHTAALESYHVGASGAEWSLSPAERVLVAGRIFWFYLSKLVWPVDLSFVYPRWQIDASRPWPYVFPVAGAALLVGLWRLRSRIGRGPAAAVLFYVVTLAPASGFFDVYPMQFSFVADHFQYLASLGPIALLCAAAVRGLGAAPLPRGPAVGAVAGCALLATLAAGTWRRTEVFQDQERLWRQALAVNPHAWLAANNLGGLLLRSGRTAEAIPWFERAIEARPRYPEAHNNLGLALARTGRPVQAVDAYRRALALDPSYTPARYNLAVALAATNDLVGAQHHLEWVVRLRPRDALALRDLGRVLALRGRLGEAVSALERAAALAPQDAFTAQQLNAVRARSGEVGNERPHR